MIWKVKAQCTSFHNLYDIPSARLQTEECDRQVSLSYVLEGVGGREIFPPLPSAHTPLLAFPGSPISP